MEIVCSICHKKQSGFLEDYPLSDARKDMRICATCGKHLRVIEKVDRYSVAKPSIAYFNRLLEQDMCLEARETISVALSKYGGQPSEAQVEINTNTYVPISSRKKLNISYVMNDSDYAKPRGSFLDNLYADIGKKIKSWAKWIFVVELTIIIVLAIAMILSGEDGIVVAGFILLLLGPLVAFVSTWILYAFGELVDKTSRNEENTREILKFLTKNNIS